MTDGDDETRARYVARVRAYYSAQLRAYLDCLGDTWQGGLLAEDEAAAARSDANGQPLDARASNLRLARRAGLGPGLRVLDAGCGVCGPAVDFAAAWPELRVVGVTLGADQAAVARRRIAAAGLSARVQAVCADFHALPLAERSFERVLFLESNGYMHAPVQALGEAWRVLRPGGELYVKGVFLPEGELRADERAQFARFDALYAHRCRPVSVFMEALRAVGFVDLRHVELNARLSSAHYFRAMFAPRGDGLTAFGRAHHRPELALRPVYAELRATRPAR